MRFNWGKAYTEGELYKNKNQQQKVHQNQHKNKIQPNMRKALLHVGNPALSVLTGKGTRVVLALFFAFLVAFTVSISIYARSAKAAPSSTINFQARLLTASGAIIPDGSVSVQFKIYDEAVAGTNEWTETQNLTAKNGYITASLGSVTSFPGTIDWSQEHWLTMNVNGDGEMGPSRMKLTAVPYSFRSGQADTLTNGSGTISASQLAQLAPGSIQGVSSSNALLRINQTGAGALLQLQSGGVDELTVANNGDTSIGGALTVGGGITVGNSTSTTAGTIRWTGTVFEGYNGTGWTSLGGSALGNPIINKVKLVSEVQNSTVNATATLQNDDELFFDIGANETWTFRFMVQGNANATPDFKFAVTAPGGATCNVSTADHEAAVSVANLGCGVSTGLVTGNTTNDLYEIVGTVRNGATAGTVQLQWAQNTANAANSTVLAGSSLLATRAVGANGSAQAFIQNGNSFGAAAYLGTNDNNDLNLITNGTTKLVVQANGNVGIGDASPASLLTVGTNDAFQVDTSGNITSTGNQTIAGLTTLGGNLVAGGVATGTTGTTAAPAQTNVTTVALTAAGGFADNDVIYINNAGQDYYTRIVSGGGTTTLTVSPAVSYDAGASVTKYTVQNIGATSTDYSTQANRFFQGYFLGGVVIGAGSTTISDGNIESTTDLTLQKNGGVVNLGGNLSVTGTITGDAAGLTNINASQISGGTVSDTALSTNVTLLGNTFNGNNQLVQLDGTGALPTLNGSALTNLSAGNLTGALPAISGAALTSLNGTNISSGTIADGRLSTNVTVMGNTFNGVNQLVQLDGSGILPALNGSALSNLNATSISSGTVADARLSANVTVKGNTFNGANGLVELDGTGNLPALNASALTNINASNISTGTIADARLSTNVTIAGNTFNGANGLVQLTGTGALPALNGAALTSLNGSNISSGTIADARLSTNVTLLGNTFNGNNQLVQLDGTGALPTLNGSALTNLSAGNLTGALPAISGAALTSLNGTNISSGTIADGRLSTNVTVMGNTFNGISQLVQLTGSGALPVLNGGALTSLSAGNLTGALPAISGAALTSLNGTNISSGTIADGRLSSNVALLNTAQSFSAQQSFAANIIVGTDTASPTAGTISFNDATGSNGFTSVLGTNSLTASRNINLPDANGTVMLLAPSGVQTDSGTGASIFINKTGASGNIITLQKNGSTVFSVLNSGALQLQLSDASAFSVSNAGGTQQYFDVDTSTAAGLVQIGGAAADANATLLVLDTKNTAGDPTGVNGGSYYNSVNNKFRCYENNLWQDCMSAINRNKTAVQTVTNSATFTNDTALVYAMAANSSYNINATINFSGTSAAADFKYTFTVPAGSAVYLGTNAATGVTTNTICNITASGQTCSVLIAANFRGIIQISGTVVTGGTAGNLQFQFAQNTQTAGQSVSVYQGSLLQVTRTNN